MQSVGGKGRLALQPEGLDNFLQHHLQHEDAETSLHFAAEWTEPSKSLLS